MRRIAEVGVVLFIMGFFLMMASNTIKVADHTSGKPVTLPKKLEKRAGFDGAASVLMIGAALCWVAAAWHTTPWRRAGLAVGVLVALRFAQFHGGRSMEDFERVRGLEALPSPAPPPG